MATTLPRNADVAEQLELLADLLELEGQDAFRVLAYRRAATRIRETGSSIAQLALDEKGEIEALTKRKGLIPPGVVSFMRLPGLGPKTARRIWQELGISTVEELRAAAEAQQLRGHAGIGPGTEEK